MKLGCSSWSYHAAFRAGRIDLRSWLRSCAEEMELDGVELADMHFPATDAAYLREIKKLCADLQLTIAGIAVTNDFGPDERRAEEVLRVQQWCDIAAYIGAPIVRVFAGWTPAQAPAADSGRIAGVFRWVFGQGQQDPQRTWSDVAHALRRSADAAEERGVVLALQNAARGGIVGTPAELERALRDAGSPWLRVCLDPADLPRPAGIDPVLRRTVQVHARLRDVGEDGIDTSAPWPELLRMLRLGSYRGFVLLDYDGVEDPETALPRAARWMRAALQALARRELLMSPEPSANGSANGRVADTVEAHAAS